MTKNTNIVQSLNTPCYVIDLNRFNENIRSIRSAFVNDWGNNILLGYSVKTNHLPFLFQHAKSQGLFAEVVSVDEYEFALSQGFESEQIIYNGPQKDEKSLIEAVNQGGVVNIDNFEDIKILEENLWRINKKFCNLGLRINFDLDSICRDENTIGKEVSRFGICIENGDFEKALLLLNKLGLPVSGLHMHYSTKTRSIAVFKSMAEKAAELITKYGLNDSIKFIDIGGGFWGGRQLPNKPTMQEYSKIITVVLKNIVSPDKVQLILEPGASILATAAEYLSKVINIRDIRDTRIVTIDGSIFHINPFLMNKPSEFSTNSSNGRKIPKQIICGSTCMEIDRLLYLDDYNEFQKGDTITFHFAGAYTMSFNNCFINCPPGVYVRNNNSLCQVRDRSKKYMSQI